MGPPDAGIGEFGVSEEKEGLLRCRRNVAGDGREAPCGVGGGRAMLPGGVGWGRMGEPGVPAEQADYE